MMNGVIVVDKPGGVTSHDVVAKIRKVLGQKQVGHFGTLDPLATGVLPVAVGRATRLQQFYLKSKKAYTGTIRLGFSTSTYDSEGEPTSELKDVEVSPDTVEAARQSFLGEIEQTPPIYSSKKIGGVSAHRLARKNQRVVLKPTRVQVSRFDLSRLSPVEVSFEIECSSGTYVRSIAHDFGQKLGCGGHLASLRRTASGEFTLSRAIDLTALDRLADEKKSADLLEQNLIPMTALLSWMPSCEMSAEESRKIKNGMALEIADSRVRALKEREEADLNEIWIRLVGPDRDLMGLALSTVSAQSNQRFQIRPKVILVER